MKAWMLGCVALGFGVGADQLDGQTAMELNQTGRWSEAATVAMSAASDSSLSVLERCEAYASLVYAEIRIGRRVDAAEHIGAFDATCTEQVAGTWLESMMDDLRVELGPVTPTTTDDWSVAADVAAIGLDAAALTEHQRLCERSAADACVVVYDGVIVQEWYGERYREPMYGMSSTKSVTGLLTGILIEEGRLSLDDPVSKFIPEWQAGAVAGVTVRHLLTMTSGLPDFPPGVPEVGTASDKEAFVFSLDLTAGPGEAWAYSNDGAFLLSPLLDRAAGEPIEEFAARRLFGPLGMTGSQLRVYPEGQAWTHADMQTTPRDLARIGQLMLQGGRWGDEQVASEAWISESIRPSQPLNPQYGLLWWLDVPGGYAARGYLDTNVYVLPDRNLVVVRMQSDPIMDAATYEPTAYSLFERMVPQ